MMFSQLFQSSPIAITLTNLSEGRYADLNPAAERLLGYRRDELLGQRPADWEAALDPAARDTLRRQIAARERVEGCACTLTTRDGDTRDCLLSVEHMDWGGASYAITHFVDVTDYRKGLLALRAPEDSPDSGAAIARASARLQALADASAAFAENGMDANVLLERLAQHAGEALAATCTIRMRADEAPWLDMAAIYDANPAIRDMAHTILDAAPIPLDSRNPTAQVFREGQPLLVPTFDPEALRALIAPEIRPVLELARPHSGMIIALRTHAETLGCITLWRHLPGQPALSHDDLTLAQDLADRAGLALAKIRIYRDMQAAQREAQQAHARLDALIASLPTGIAYFDHELRYQLVNPAMAAINRRAIDAHIGEPLAAILPELAVRLTPLLRRVIETGEALSDFELQGKMRPKENGSRTWQVSCFPVAGPADSIAGVGVMVNDISASKQVEQQLRQSESRFATIFERSPIALCIARMSDGVITDINPAFVGLSGMPREAIVGQTALALGLWGRLEDRDHLYHQLRTHGRISNFEIIAQTAAGDLRHALLSGELVQIHDETQIVIQFIDISALKAAQLELRELNRTLEERVAQRTAEVQDLYEHAPTGYYSLDAHGQIISINQTLLDWLGYARDEAVGRLFSDFIVPTYRDSFSADFTRFKQRGVLRDIDGELLRKDGSSFPVLLNASAIYAADGAYISSRATVFDNTRRRQAEEALRESEAQNRLLFEESPEAMALFDNSTRVVRANRAFAQLIGHPLAQIIDQTASKLDLLSPAQIAQLMEQVGPALRHDPGFTTATIGFTTADGERRVVETRAFALTIRGQERYLTAIHDITAERQTEETLRMANAELARAARAKDEFLATMSHELRTPINAVLGFSESLQDAIYGPLSPRQSSAVEHIMAGGRHLLSLVNDILDLAKVEAGRMDLQREWVSAHEICQISLVFIKDQALKKRLRISSHIDEQLTLVKADATRLKQMLVNLLSNAVKFTPSGGTVSLSVSVDAAAEEVRFAVRDSGIGISPADLGRLFQPFSQLAPTLSREYEGSGLGLALVRRLANLHGGDVTVESAVGQGSCFTIALPHKPVPDALGAEAHSQSAPPWDVASCTPDARILLAEDNETNIDVVSDYLQARGYTVIVARDGGEVLARVGKDAPQLILMDIQMPGMDGLEAIRRLRALPAHAATPIIALTALAMPGDEERCLAAGATAYMTKPVGLKELLRLIQHTLRP